jgi:hypothetical protein
MFTNLFQKIRFFVTRIVVTPALISSKIICVSVVSVGYTAKIDSSTELNEDLCKHKLQIKEERRSLIYYAIELEKK